MKIDDKINLQKDLLFSKFFLNSKWDIKFKLLNFLIRNLNEKFYEAQIIEKTNISKSSVSKVINELINDNIVQVEKLGNLKLVWIEGTSLLWEYSNFLKSLYLILDKKKN